MCNDFTKAEMQAYIADKQINRRGFTKSAAASVAMISIGLKACASPSEPVVGITETAVAIPSPDGEIDGVFYAPDTGSTAAVIMWPDIHGLRPAFHNMARRMAGDGYAVIAANPYYRTFNGRLFQDGEHIRDEGGFDRVRPHYSVLSPDTVKTDAAAIVDWLDTQPAVDTGRGIGAMGYCMTGSWTLRAAAHLPARVKAPASFHGGGLVTDKPDSPHKLVSSLSGGALIAIAENDDAKDPETQPALIKAFADAGVPADIKVYPGAMHGWCKIDSPVYNEEQAEQAWSNTLNLFETQLA